MANTDPIEVKARQIAEECYMAADLAQHQEAIVRGLRDLVAPLVEAARQISKGRSRTDGYAPAPWILNIVDRVLRDYPAAGPARKENE